jgi:dolichol kinase
VGTSGGGRGAGLSLRAEGQRKALHLLSAATPLALAAGVPRVPLAWGLAALLAVAIAVELGQARLAPMRALFLRLTSHLLRDHEHTGWSGASWMLAAHLLAVLLFPRATAIAALWAVSVGDAAAALVGRAAGRHRLASGKSVEGTLACFVVTLAGALWLAGLPAGGALVAAASASIAELPSRPLDDNLRIVLFTGFAISLWHLVFR